MNTPSVDVFRIDRHRRLRREDLDYVSGTFATSARMSRAPQPQHPTSRSLTVILTMCNRKPTT